MPLPSSIRTATFHYNGASLRLQATFANLEKLKQHTGKSPFEYIFAGMDGDNIDEMMEMIRTLFFCLQTDVEQYTEGQIHDWLFGDFAGFFTQENVQQVQDVLGHIIGEDLKAKVPDVAPTEDSQKK